MLKIIVHENIENCLQKFYINNIKTSVNNSNFVLLFYTLAQLNSLCILLRYLQRAATNNDTLPAEFVGSRNNVYAKWTSRIL